MGILKRPRLRALRAPWLVMLIISAGCATATAPTLPTPSATPAPTATAPMALARKTVVVADFEGGSLPPRQDTQFWSRALASFLIADLRDSQHLTVIDRQHLADILREQRLSASDLSDPATRLRLGRIIGASYFIFGTYTILGDAATLVARMDNVETGQVIKAEQAAGTVAEMRQLSRKLSVAFLGGLDQRLAEQEATRRTEVGGPPVDAVRAFSEGLDYEAQGAYDKAVDMYTKALTLYPTYHEAREHLEKASEAAARQ